MVVFHSKNNNSKRMNLSGAVGEGEKMRDDSFSILEKPIGSEVQVLLGSNNIEEDGNSSDHSLLNSHRRSKSHSNPILKYFTRRCCR